VAGAKTTGQQWQTNSTAKMLNEQQQQQ